MSRESKSCGREDCDQLIHWADDEPKYRYDRRQYCSKACGNLARSAARVGQSGEAEKKTCAQCQRVFTRNVRTTSPGRWAARLFCSTECFGRSKAGVSTARPLELVPELPAEPVFAPADTASSWRQVGEVWRPSFPGFPETPNTARRAS